MHIWHASQDFSSDKLEYLKAILSFDEAKRAEKFIFDKDHKNYIAARGLLRILLSNYLNLDPEEIKFSYNKYGKPILDNDRNLKFNISHSGSKFICGITIDKSIGVDIEKLRAVDNADEIVESNFSESEKLEYKCIPDRLKQKAFFAFWTRKEAYIKAIGKGLFFPLNDFSVSIMPDKPAKILHFKNDLQKISEWTIEEINLSKEHVAAVAVESRDCSFQCNEWDWKLFQQ